MTKEKFISNLREAINEHIKFREEARQDIKDEFGIEPNWEASWDDIYSLFEEIDDEDKIRESNDLLTWASDNCSEIPLYQLFDDDEEDCDDEDDDDWDIKEVISSLNLPFDSYSLDYDYIYHATVLYYELKDYCSLI